jgi:lipopolysaccharide/colanic/teichoic acid biosynthesis glycosyltransferase
MVLIAFAIYIHLGRDILFTQRRTGLDGVPFDCYKFRTMRPCRRNTVGVSVEATRRSGLPSANDPRHTPFGSFLRRLGLDELPQLVNVLRGEMSLVGPRPEIATITPEYSEHERGRFAVKPGLTGYWQVTCRSDAIDLRTFAHVDIEYAQKISLFNDIRIMLRTPVAMLRHPAATENWRGRNVMTGRQTP